MRRTRWRSQSALVSPLAMSCLDSNISLVPGINSWYEYLQPYCPLQHKYKHTKPQSHKATKIHTLRPLTYLLIVQKRVNVFTDCCACESLYIVSIKKVFERDRRDLRMNTEVLFPTIKKFLLKQSDM